MAQQTRRPPILGPVILITIGILALLHNFGQLPANFWQTVWRLWPLLLILLGIEILIGQLRLPWGVSMLLALLLIVAAVAGVLYLAWWMPEERAVSTGEMEHLEQPLQGAKLSVVSLSFGAGTLRVGAVSSDHILVGDFRQGQARVSYTVTNDKGDLRIAAPEHQAFPIFISGRGNEWDVRLNSTIPLELRVESGASTNHLDLSDLRLTSLTVRGGLSTNDIRLPTRGDYSARISGGLTTTTIHVPEGMAARIRIEGGLSTVNVDAMRFARAGDEYVSPNYTAATDRVDLHIEGGLATVTVR